MNELKKKLEGKQKHIDVLQQEIYDIAYSGQKPVDFKQIKVRIKILDFNKVCS